MALHHRREIGDIRRYAYDQDNSRGRTYPPLHNDRSYEKQHSRSDTQQPSSGTTSNKPQVHHHTREHEQTYEPGYCFEDGQFHESPQSSVKSFVSTVRSEDDFPGDLPESDVAEDTRRPSEAHALAATPSEFSQLFPSHRRLKVRHDDTTIDGNMNLRVDTDVTIQGRHEDMTLYHLKMHDLRTRNFSLRRYCRDSGREVCHSVPRCQARTVEKRPGFQRSLSNALNSMRPKAEHRRSASRASDSLKRHDSGYGSVNSADFDRDERPQSSGNGAIAHDPPPSSVIKLEFSNYAQLEIKRSGGTGSRRYEFDYWGVAYTWRRIARKSSGLSEVSYHLTKSGSDRVLAYVVPTSLSEAEAKMERKKGGWIPPSTIWIEDPTIVRAQKDVADVVIAAGLMALVDDTIRTKFHSEEEKGLSIPVPKFHVDIEYMGAKRLFDEMFNRKDGASSSRSRPTSSSRP